MNVLESEARRFLRRAEGALRAAEANLAKAPSAAAVERLKQANGFVAAAHKMLAELVNS
jgi:Tfp pilus assembly protein PilX